VWASAVITAVLFFVSIVLHELSHALVARARGVSVRSITLFALGGVATMENPSPDAKTEFWVAAAGPIASVAIGLGCYALAASLGWSPQADVSPSTAVLGWLGYINISLAVFNLIPGFPLDGGRILRAILWGRSGDADRATMTAARVGQAVAFGFILLGVMQFFGGAGFGGLWIAFIGWFLLQAAQASYAQVAVVADLRLPVMSEGKFAGMVGRRHILLLLQARAELNLPATPSAAVPLTGPRPAAAPVS
jgi:Zn-dependent protease